jgi:hypothetical protein
MCVEKVPAGVKAKFPKEKHVMRHVFTSQNINDIDEERYIYHLSIIDYLQSYNLSKQGENCLKTKL